MSDSDVNLDALAAAAASAAPPRQKRSASAVDVQRRAAVATARASAQARSAGARALEDLAFRCDVVEMAQVCVEPQSRAYPFDGGDAVAGALARGLRKRNAPPSRR